MVVNTVIAMVTRRMLGRADDRSINDRNASDRPSWVSFWTVESLFGEGTGMCREGKAARRKSGKGQTDTHIEYHNR